MHRRVFLMQSTFVSGAALLLRHPAFAATDPNSAPKGEPHMSTKIEEFRLNVPQSQLADLHDRLTHTRWPERETVDDTSQGPQLAKVQALVAHWRTKYDWRKCEALLNGFGHFKTNINGLDIQFLHIVSPEPDALPLLMCHGWPGSILEFRKVIEPLSNPAKFGGDPRKAFHLVIPSMPGFGFSDKPSATGWSIPQIADAWITLMDRLGYKRWGAQGGDLGFAVIDSIAEKKPKQFVGFHSNFIMMQPTPDEIAQATPQEKDMFASEKDFWDKLSGYAKEQSTRPQTIGYSLADSPVGLATWIYAMFQDTCGTPGNAEATFTLDELLDDIMMYWLPNTGASSARLYWEMVNSHWHPSTNPSKPIHVPAGFTMFPQEAVRKSRRLIEARYNNLVYFNEAAHGGHFGALEQPEVIVSDVRKTFDTLR
ncbi:epoxide hydrolase family protein [Granulicella rosea]|nr:epoxide hydrolase [Granulicella rosea]